MAEGTKLEIVSPEKLLLSETVKSVTVPGTDGYFTVLGDHAPFMTTMKPGFVTVVNSAGISHVYYVRGGFAEVNAQGLTLLAETAIPYADLDGAAIARQIKDAEEDVNDAKTDTARAKAAEALDHLKALQAAL